MKRYGNIYEKIYSMDNLRLAYYKASEDKSYYTEVIEIEKDIDKHLKSVQQMLKDKTYVVNSSNYTMFTKNDKGKIREIFKLDFFPHRIIQWALILQIEDIMEKDFISNTFSSLPNRGIHLALEKMDRDLRGNVEKTQYCLKIDIRKFYPSINHEINKRQYRRKFKDRDLLWLIDMLIDSLNKNEVTKGIKRENDVNVSDEKTGIAIGSLFSQWDGLFYLSPMCHWLKEVKKVKFLYVYCDDFVILHHDKKHLHKLRVEIDSYLKENLKLELKDNYQVFEVEERGVDFVGYRHFRKYVLLRKSTSKNLIKKMRRLIKKCERGGELTYSEWCSINSYKGWMKWANCYNLYVKWIKPLEPYCDKYYNSHVKTKKAKVK